MDDTIGFQMVHEDSSIGGSSDTQSPSSTSLRHSLVKRQYAQQMLRGLQQRLALIRNQKSWDPDILNEYYTLKDQIRSLKHEFIYKVWDNDEHDST